ncbi:MAG TPA: LysR substrate-binding domain-containing protein [Abditibacterium sp.]|jgi:LysR family cyn operon transcriptional activator
MELRHLRYFLAVADAAHFTKAAQKLWVSQPTLSQQIKQLEDELGTPLFHRGSGGVQLTASGEKFRPYAERALREMEAAVVALGEDEELTGESLKVGALETTGDYLLPEVVARAVSESKLQIRVETLPALELQWAVARSELDLAVGALPAASVVAEPLFDEDLALWTPPHHRLGSLSRARLAELDGVGVFCLSSDSPLRSLLEDGAGRAGISLRVLAEFSSAEAVLRAAVAANSPAILPAPMLQLQGAPALQLGWHVVALTNPRPHRTIALLRRRGREENPALRAFVAHLNGVVGALFKAE